MGGGGWGTTILMEQPINGMGDMLELDLPLPAPTHSACYPYLVGSTPFKLSVNRCDVNCPCERALKCVKYTYREQNGQTKNIAS